MPERIFLSLGSNIEAQANLLSCVRLLAERFRILAVSRVYDTAPVGLVEQDNFLNGAVLIETELGVAELKREVLTQIEESLGRVRSDEKNAPRRIDIDISLVGDKVMTIGTWRIPDPDVLKHGHVALPLADLDPDFRHPETGQTLAEIASQFAGQPGIDVREDVDLRDSLIDSGDQKGERPV